MPNSRACVDSNVVIKLAVDEDASDAVRMLWERWERDDTQIVAPTLVWYEIASSLRKKVVREALTEDEAGDALDKLLSCRSRCSPSRVTNAGPGRWRTNSTGHKPMTHTTWR